MNTQEEVEEFEEMTGLTFDNNGPELLECEYCSKSIQYVPDHDCWGMRCETNEINTYWGEL